MEIIKRLATTHIGREVAFKDFKLKVRLAITGCKGCAFDNGEGARYCYLSVACMAHSRPDRNPVKFVLVE